MRGAQRLGYYSQLREGGGVLSGGKAGVAWEGFSGCVVRKTDARLG
jgi:hypothetical protein